jgi:hypothetical protein
MVRTDQELPVKAGKKFRVSTVNLSSESSLLRSTQKLMEGKQANGKA